MPIDQLTGAERKQFMDALLSAFYSRSLLAQMVKLELDESLEHIVSEGTLVEVTFALVQWAEAGGRQKDLLTGARKANPDNPLLRTFDEQIHGRTRMRGIAPMAPPPGIRQGSTCFSSIDVGRVANWYRQMQICAQAVCRIEHENGMGTGFLVAPSIVMTSYSVVANSDKAVVRFNYTSFVDMEATLEVQVNPLGQAYRLSPDWLIDSDPDLDYALLRVDGTPGHDPVPAHRGFAPRNWLRPDLSYVFKVDEPIFLFHHPYGEPLSIIYGTNAKLNQGQKRVQYTAATQPGSAGSPCFNANWKLVAMHQGNNTERRTSSAEPVGRFGVPIRSVVMRQEVLTALFDEAALG